MAKKKATKKKASSSSSSKSKSTKGTAKKKTSSAGRPEGSKHIERPSTEVELSQCPRCGSTSKSTVGQGPMVQAHRGIHHGKAYTHILRRRMICQNCGQHRIDITRENRPETIASSN